MKLLALFLALAAGAVAADKPLAIVRSVFASSEDGPPDAVDQDYVQGQTVYFSCLVEGYRRIDKPNDFPRKMMAVKYHIEVRDKSGVLLQAPQDGKIETTITHEDEHWTPKLREKIIIPSLAETGEYFVTVHLSDEYAKTDIDSRSVFHVRGRNVAPSDTLVVRNFRFLRSEDQDKALEVAAYRPGDMVWAKFDMTGYKFGDKNSVNIDYGLKVLREDGSVAYQQPEAATQQIQTFYPQRYQPGELSLNLGKTQPLGKYTIVLTVHDNIGKQTYETRETFSVE